MPTLRLTSPLDEQERTSGSPCAAAGVDAGGSDSTCGVGLLLARTAIGQQERVEVVRVLPGGPAEVAKGDVLVAIRDADAQEASRGRLWEFAGRKGKKKEGE